MNVLNQTIGDRFAIYHADCIDVLRGIPDNSIDYSIFSPPFASLYTYSASPRDMGNCLTHEDFFAHFRYLVPELLRVLKPGRLLSFHCMNLPTIKARDGYIGITDFRGDLIRAFTEVGWIYHSEVCIWKDPVTAMQRTKAIGLLYKQLKKDSALSRQGIPDYLVTMRKPGPDADTTHTDLVAALLDIMPSQLVTMRKPGVNPDPVTKDPEAFPVDLWQRYASPVWMDIDPNDTLQYRSAREHDDERHICPLQLEVIRRGIKLWTNQGDVVLSPFGGIGSEGYVALEEGRRFIGAELKQSYYEQAARNLASVDQPAQATIF